VLALLSSLIILFLFQSNFDLFHRFHLFVLCFKLLLFLKVNIAEEDSVKWKCTILLLPLFRLNFYYINKVNLYFIFYNTLLVI